MSFFDDFTLDKALSAYQSIAVAKAQAKGVAYQGSQQNQSQTLHSAEFPNGQNAVDGGNAVVPGAATKQMVSGVDNRLIVGGGLLLLAVGVIAAVK